MRWKERQGQTQRWLVSIWLWWQEQWQKPEGQRQAKGKGKKGKKGKGKQNLGCKGRSDRNTCRICGQQGHWGNERSNRQNVANINEQTPQVAESDIASSAQGTARAQGSGSSVAVTAYTTSTRPQVRQVRMYHLETPRNDQRSLWCLTLRGKVAIVVCTMTTTNSRPSAS